jgi:hypothetical protein
METIFSVRGKRVGVAIEQTHERTSVTVDGESLAIEEVSIDERYVTMRIGARVVRVPYARSGAHVHVASAARATSSSRARKPKTRPAAKAPSCPRSPPRCRARSWR